jgi:sodium transport system ATP-binding protein
MIEVLELSKTFPISKKKVGKSDDASDPREAGDGFRALADVTFNAVNGKITGLLGSNGAGKTTLLRILATSLKPTQGVAKIDGLDVVTQAMEVRRRIGFLSGATGLYGRLTPLELLTFFGKMHGLRAADLKHRIDALFEDLQIAPYAHKRCDLLSTGMKQKVSIARSLIHRPSVVIFDEPTTGLDVSSAHGILSYIDQCRRVGKTVLFSTHHMHEVEKLCDRVVIIRRGAKCFEGTVKQMLETSGTTHLDDAYLALSGEQASVVPKSALRERMFNVV